jgi:hypothetical protein
MLKHWVCIMDMAFKMIIYGNQFKKKMKSCIHVWKSRNLIYGGKSLIIINVLLYLCGYEIEMLNM